MSPHFFPLFPPFFELVHSGNVKIVLAGAVIGILGIAFAAASPNDRRGAALLLGLLYGIPALALLIHGGHQYWSSPNVAPSAANVRVLEEVAPHARPATPSSVGVGPRAPAAEARRIPEESTGRPSPFVDPG